MVDKKFKPNLAPNEQVSLEEIPNIKDKLVSVKLDGVRTLPQEKGLLSRSLKEIRSLDLQEKFKPLVKLAKKYNIILDGEIYSHEYTFDEIKSFVMNTDVKTGKHLKNVRKRIFEGKWLKSEAMYTSIPDNLKFYCFDCYFINEPNLKFSERILKLQLILSSNNKIFNILKLVDHYHFEDIKSIEDYYNKIIEDGYEGLMIKDKNSVYKFGRNTIKQGVFFKFKPFETYDAQIIKVLEGTSVDPNAEKSINELGHSVTSKKQADRINNGKAENFLVIHNRQELKVTLKTCTDIEKENIWKNRDNYIGRWIEYSGFEIGSQNVPRYPKWIRFRDDKE